MSISTNPRTPALNACWANTALSCIEITTIPGLRK